MHTVSGYINEGNVVLDEKLSEWQGRRVMVTILGYCFCQSG